MGKSNNIPVVPNGTGTCGDCGGTSDGQYFCFGCRAKSAAAAEATAKLLEERR